MKTLLLSLFFTFPLVIFGQNWAPVNPKWSPQFAQEGSNEVEFSIKIDSTASDFSSLSMYYLHPTYLKCESCETPISECTSPYDSLYLKQSPLLGDSIFRLEDRYTLFGPELYLKTAANLGESYAFALGGLNPTVATVTAYNEIEVFGISDSTKTFSFDDGREIVLSKNYGIISFTTEPGSTQTLAGIPELQLGNYFPGMREFYSFEVGDVFMYASSSYSSQISYSGLSRVDITAVETFSDSVKITYNTSGIGTTWDPYPSSTSSSYTEGNVQTIAFKNHSLQGLIPGMLTYEIDSTKMFLQNTSIEPTSPYYNSYFAIETEHNSRRGISIGGFTAHFNSFPYIPGLEIYMVNAVGDAVKARSLACDQQAGYTNYLLNDSLSSNSNYIGSGEVFLEYTEGLGATCFYQELGLVNNLTVMIGYQKGEETYGNIYASSEILDTRKILTEADVQVYPNPAKTQITISIPDQYSGTFDISLTDMAGRLVLKQNGFNNNGSIDMHNLSAGSYLLFGTNSEVAFTRKVIVE